MNDIWNLTRRHIKNYYRDKTSVFFSFLSVIILLAVYLLFLGKMYDDIILPTELMKTRFMVGYIMGGVLVVAALTLSLGVIGTYVNDLESKKINGILVTPVKRWKVIISYFLSTFLLTLLLTLTMLFLVVLYLGIKGYWMPLLDLLEIVGVVALYVIISVPIVVMLVSFIKSSNAFGALSSIIGTVIGFVSGIYIPLSMLDPFTSTLASFLPFSHMTIHLRRLLMGNDLIAFLPQEALTESSLNYISIFGLNINRWFVLLGFLMLSFGFLAVAYVKMNKKSTN